MRIAYLVLDDLSRMPGVWKKVVGQVEQWRLLGHDPAVFACEPRRATHSDLIHDSRAAAYPDYAAAYILRSLTALRVRRELSDFRPDIVYMRFGVFTPFVSGTLEVARAPVIIEVNSDDVAEYDRYGPMIGGYNRLTRGLLLSRAAGFVSVTDELRARLGRPAVLHVVVPNGVAWREFARLPAPGNDRPNIVFVGSSDQPWQGVDKITYLAKRCPEFTFHVVGPKNVEVLPNVVVHGWKLGKDLQQIYAVSDAAIGTLALHRKGMNEASPLKVREYLAYGIPSIIGYHDPDLEGHIPGILKLPNHEHNVANAVSEIRQFIVAHVGKRVGDGVKLLIDSGRKEAKRVGFFQMVLDQHRRQAPL
ncbi:MAG: glycosyltransferase family 4 protein [Ignavibacteriales bacterium]